MSDPRIIRCTAHGCSAEVLVNEPRHLDNLAAWRCPAHRPARPKALR